MPATIAMRYRRRIGACPCCVSRQRRTFKGDVQGSNVRIGSIASSCRRSDQGKHQQSAFAPTFNMGLPSRWFVSFYPSANSDSRSPVHRSNWYFAPGSPTVNPRTRTTVQKYPFDVGRCFRHRWALRKLGEEYLNEKICFRFVRYRRRCVLGLRDPKCTGVCSASQAQAPSPSSPPPPPPQVI
jgi:hypothetical protein